MLRLPASLAAAPCHLRPFFPVPARRVTDAAHGSAYAAAYAAAYARLFAQVEELGQPARRSG